MIKIDGKKIEVHVTDLSYGCIRQLCLLAKNPSPERESAAMKFGTDVHSAIHQRMLGACPSSIKMDTEVEALLMHEDTAYTQLNITSSTKDYTIAEAKQKFNTPVCVETPQELMKWFMVNNIVATLVSDEVVTIHSFGRTSQWEILNNIHPAMFGMHHVLTEFEKPVRMELMKGDWTLSIIGRIDACSKNATLIVDWKTAGRTPSEKLDYAHANYYIQQMLYRRLYIDQHKLPYHPCTDSVVLLFYIVKVKVPKVMVYGFKVTQKNLDAIDNLIFNAFNGITTFLEEGILPGCVHSEKCQYCQCQTECNEESSLIPQPEGLIALQYTLSKIV